MDSGHQHRSPKPLSSTSPSYTPNTSSSRSTPPTHCAPSQADIPAASQTVLSTVSRSKPTALAPPSPSSLARLNPKLDDPGKLVKPRHHIPHHPYRHHPRESIKSVQNALLQTTAFGELLSPVKHVAGGFFPGSGSTDGEGQSSDLRSDRVADHVLDSEDIDYMGEKEGRRAGEAAVLEDVHQLRERRMVGEEYLRKQLASLSEVATSTTRHLDYTYYSLLSTIPTIENTISGLRDLATESQTLLNEFTTSSIPSLTTDFSSQIASLHENFDQVQSDRITGLENRMKGARKQVENLGLRVEGVRTKVEQWEVREREGKKRGRRRIGILWGALGVLFSLVVILTVVKDRMGESDDLNARERLKAGRRMEKILGFDAIPKRGTMEDDNPSTTKSAQAESRNSDRTRQHPLYDDLDARLRIFDEL